jgi:hypothetical protein
VALRRGVERSKEQCPYQRVGDGVEVGVSTQGGLGHGGAQPDHQSGVLRDTQLLIEGLVVDRPGGGGCDESADERCIDGRVEVAVALAQRYANAYGDLDTPAAIYEISGGSAH